MPEHIRPDELNHLVTDRIHDLQATASELRAARRQACHEVGLMTRTRWSIGRRLISIGSAVAGQHV